MWMSPIQEADRKTFAASRYRNTKYYSAHRNMGFGCVFFYVFGCFYGLALFGRLLLPVFFLWALSASNKLQKSKQSKLNHEKISDQNSYLGQKLFCLTNPNNLVGSVLWCSDDNEMSLLLPFLFFFLVNITRCPYHPKNGINPRSGFGLLLTTKCFQRLFLPFLFDIC